MFRIRVVQMGLGFGPGGSSGRLQGFYFKGL